MYNREILNDVISFIQANDGINDKNLLAKLVKDKFGLVTERKVFFNDSFAIRFSESLYRRCSNTILSLSALRKYDSLPFIVCIVSPSENHILLANTTFLKKISHSSQELRMDNIKGSFNASDIIRDYEGVENKPENFEYLFSSHENYTFNENLRRLVETTNNISPIGEKYEPNVIEKNNIKNSVERAMAFVKSECYSILDDDLRNRVNSVETAILAASCIENVNIRGRIIEYLITNTDSLRETLIKCLRENEPLPKVFTSDKLGDYERDFNTFMTATDIKTKMLFLSSNPKGYNIDKLLRFLSSSRSVYLIYIVAIGSDHKIKTQLCSVFNRQLLHGTRIIKHWAGRNSRGVTQYTGETLEEIVENYEATIDTEEALAFVETLLAQ